MKKVVVVVSSIEKKEETFLSSNDKLSVIDGTASNGVDYRKSNSKLVIRDDKETIGVFQRWEYWKKES